ncbi:M23 family metallopeptidase [Microbacterium flavum]|uniref:M23 family metallopeptidase n=1 Tax=Microbacterium flavum TaxID=415216 RepID=UPI0024AD0923|nr:M23 family metallopeptidase [Microbacterium flavum]
MPPTRRSARRPVVTAPAAPLTRAEYRRRAAAADAAPERDPASEASVPEQVSLAESVVAYVAAAIVAESVGDAPDEAARRRLRAAAHEVFAEVVARVDTVAIDVVAGAADVPGTPAAPAAPGASFVRPDAACADDEFAFAARLFSFTGETPIQRPAAQGASSPAPVSAATAPHVARRRPRRGVLFQRLAAASFSIGVMSIVGLLAVGTTTPAEAITPTSVTTSDITAAASTTAKRDSGAIQAFVAGDVAQPAALDRPEGYGVASMADLAADSGVTIFASAGQGTWVNNPSAAIQWPFPVGVPISAAYGSSSYLAEFSSAHSGTDLTPGAGAEIHAVAAGTVRIATEDGGDYGVTVVIDHIIDGQPVATRYGHMQYGSLQVTQGQVVKAGEVIGKVGQTGKATGPHLHLEVLLNGNTRTDPMPWLYEHTTGTHTVG